MHMKNVGYAIFALELHNEKCSTFWGGNAFEANFRADKRLQIWDGTSAMIKSNPCHWVLIQRLKDYTGIFSRFNEIPRIWDRSFFLIFLMPPWQSWSSWYDRPRTHDRIFVRVMSLLCCNALTDLKCACVTHHCALGCRLQNRIAFTMLIGKWGQLISKEVNSAKYKCEFCSSQLSLDIECARDSSSGI